MSNLPPDLNPYASPAAPDELVRQPVVSSYELVKEVKQFRAEIHALGGLWIGVGSIPLVIAAIGVSLEERISLDTAIGCGIMMAIGLSFLFCGIFTCYKQLLAVYIGLVLSYLMASLSLLSMNLCIVIAFGSGIFGGHRIISWANSLRRKGIPLTTRPRDIQTPLQLPPMFPPEKSPEWPK